MAARDGCVQKLFALSFLLQRFQFGKGPVPSGAGFERESAVLDAAASDELSTLMFLPFRKAPFDVARRDSVPTSVYERRCEAGCMADEPSQPIGELG